MKRTYSTLALTLTLSLFGNFAFAKAAEKTPVKAAALNITGEDIAEYIYFSTAHKKTLTDLVETSHLNAPLKKQVMAYLKGHNLGSANIPKLKYTAGTSIIIFGEGNKIDYSLARKNQIVVNGQTLAIPADAAFSDAVKKIQGAMNRSTSQSLIFPMNLISQAYAAGTESEAATAAVGILSTRAVCPELEDQSSEPCPFKSDADYLKDRSIRQQGANIEVLTIGLKCEGDKFASSTTRVTGPGMPGMIEKTTLVYDKDGTEKIIRNDVAGGVYCEMKVKDGGFDSITYDATGSDGCNFGSTDNGKIRTPGNGFQKGDKIQRMGGMNLPLRRLRSCCKSDECKAQMNIYIAENLNKNSGSKAKQNTPAPVQ